MATADAKKAADARAAADAKAAAAAKQLQSDLAATKEKLDAAVKVWFRGPGEATGRPRTW